MKTIVSVIIAFFLSASMSYAQKLSPQWEELTSSDFALAVKQSEGVCVVPIGVLEKHGQQLPLGTDVFTSRELCRRAAGKEYCLIYPFYFMGQIFEAQHQPGTVAYSSELQLRLLDETCKEIARNGIKKIILVNGHGGNNAFLQYFCQIQLATPHDYAVYAVITPSVSPEVEKKITEMRKTTTGGHADEVESSSMLAVRPDLVKIERATLESGSNQHRQHLPSNVFTGISWYAQYPNHYAGDAKDANKELGELSIESRSQGLADIIKAVKADQETLRLQNDFYKESQSPLDTKVK